MWRRNFIRGLGGVMPAFAGCVGTQWINSTPRQPSSADTEPAVESDFQRSVEVTQVDAVDDAFGVDLQIVVEQPTLSHNHTATLKSTVTNTGDSTGRFRPAYYKGSSGGSGTAGILLYSLTAPDSPPSNYTPECIGTSGKSSDQLVWTTESLPLTELQPAETMSNRLIVVDDPTEEGCIPPGTYQFETAYKIGESQDASPQFTWGFTLEITADR